MIDVDTLCDIHGMEEPCHRLRVARENSGFRSAMAAAKKFGWTVSTYGAHENGQNGFDPETALKYAKALKVSASWILTGEGEPPKPREPLIRSYDPDEPERFPDANVPEGRPVEVPAGSIAELVARGGLGTGHVIESRHAGEMKTVDEVKEEFWKFPPTFVRHVIGSQISNLVAIECQGDSMSPTLVPGERVWIDRAQNTLSPEGIYAIRDPHEAIVIKRLEYTDDKPRRIAVISDNPKHTIRYHSLEDIAIVGRVVCVMRVF